MANNNSKKVLIIGSGFGGLSSAPLLSKAGYEVTVVEKNSSLGGRARAFTEAGFTFDMGPSWYMMPDIFEHYFSLFNKKPSDYLELERLSPSYRVFVESDPKHYDIMADRKYMKDFFESIEIGAGDKLIDYLDKSKYQYEIAKKEFMFKNYNSIFDFINKRVMKEGSKLPLFKSVSKIIKNYFKSNIINNLLSFHTILLGTSPQKTPGIYCLMSHIDIDGGIWYPKGGLIKLVDALERLGKELNVKYLTNTGVNKIVIENGLAKGVELESGQMLEADIVISGADIVHTDTKLISPEYRVKKEKYWEKAKLTPSAFIMYLGIKGKIDKLVHHNLIFSKDWNFTEDEVFNKKTLPTNPSLYICKPTHSDKGVAPDNHENVFVLVPINYDIELNQEQIKNYEEKILDHMAKELNVPDLKERIVFKKTYTVDDFKNDYNAYKGNSLGGMSHTLSQTAFFRPNNYNPKVKNLYYVGAGTNPGIGVPICLISAELVYKRIEGIKEPGPLTTI